ncbi:UNVERIFIED_CONTAM: Retrovirus-related Pol polyprotein from transposon TNT 1-94 [Sesamum radiatum]|uniref:Retrovirus-related Pol polyprotein from transposon TNT 1-94 n=1 Tax=Sesamum radiatum TaxID=300843 RepID=A0AAW2QGC0_SESRA
MREEMKSLKDNKTWVLVPKPKNTSIVDSKWIFKLKNENDSLRYKARLVAKGFTQKEGIDYTEIFSPVVKYTTVRIILALTAHFDWELKQMDVKTAFLHGDLDENIYMAQPCGFIDNRNLSIDYLLRGTKCEAVWWKLLVVKQPVVFEFRVSLWPCNLGFGSKLPEPIPTVIGVLLSD